MSDTAVAMVCVTALFYAALGWHALTSSLRTRERCEEIRRNELHANVQDELIKRQAALEERLRKYVEGVDAKVAALDLATTAELKAMKRAFDQLGAKEAAHAFVNQAATGSRMF